METFKSASIIIALIFSGCFVVFLIWILIMVHKLKEIPNQKIEVLGDFFSKLPIKKFFGIFSNNTINKKNK